MTHDPRDEKVAAQLLCDVFYGNLPDDYTQETIDNGDARRLLDALQAKGWKITQRMHPTSEHLIGYWSVFHDDLPICPREDR